MQETFLFLRLQRKNVENLTSIITSWKTSLESISFICFLRFSCSTIKRLFLCFSCVLQFSILHLLHSNQTVIPVFFLCFAILYLALVFLSKSCIFHIPLFFLILLFKEALNVFLLFLSITFAFLVSIPLTLAGLVRTGSHVERYISKLEPLRTIVAIHQ